MGLQGMPSVTPTRVLPFGFGRNRFSFCSHRSTARGLPCAGGCHRPISASCCWARCACRMSRAVFLSAQPCFHGLHSPHADALRALIRRWVRLVFTPRGSSHCRFKRSERFNVAFDLFLLFVSRQPQIVVSLQARPHFGAGAKVSRQP